MSILGASRSLISSLADSYFRPWEREAVIYERLGVRRFKRYLPTGGDLYAKRMNWHPVLDSTGGRIAALTKLEKRTRLAEGAHVVTFFFFATITVAGLSEGGRFVPAILLIVFNVGFNVYPIMVQRFNRHRMLRILERRSHRQRVV